MKEDLIIEYILEANKEAINKLCDNIVRNIKTYSVPNSLSDQEYELAKFLDKNWLIKHLEKRCESQGITISDEERKSINGLISRTKPIGPIQIQLQNNLSTDLDIPTSETPKAQFPHKKLWLNKIKDENLTKKKKVKSL